LKAKTITKLRLFVIILILTLFLNLTSVQSTLNKSELSERVFLLNEDFLIKNRQTEIDINSPDSLSVVETFVAQNINPNSQNSINLWFNTSLNTIIVEDLEGGLNFDWIPISNISNRVQVFFREPITQNETVSFSIKYNLETSLQLTEGEENYYSFEFYSTITYPTTVYTMSIILPERSFIHESEGVSPFYPTNATQILIKNRIVISWIENNVSAHSNPFFLLRFNEPLPLGENAPFFKSSFTVFLIGVLAGIFLGISGTSWLIRYREKKAMKKLGMTLLTENQKKLISIIHQRNGKVSQKELCQITGYSKSKISRNLSPLELRGLIKREKWGRTYVVYLTDAGRTVIE